jgi:hypothetical protein
VCGSLIAKSTADFRSAPTFMLQRHCEGDDFESRREGRRREVRLDGSNRKLDSPIVDALAKVGSVPVVVLRRLCAELYFKSVLERRLLLARPKVSE